MGSRLYVGNLAYAVTEDSLRAVFEGGGHTVVDCQVVMDRETGRSRGFGFVEVESQEQAQAAISGLDGFELDGRPLRISEARERTERGGGGGGGGRGGGGGGRY